VRHLAVPAIARPRLASFVTYLLGASLAYAVLRLKGRRFDVIQATDCSFPVADVCYAHFCHRAYLSETWPRIRGRMGPRTAHTWANHAVRAALEARLVRRARIVVVPSSGLGRDLARVYPGVGEKVRVIPNTVDFARFERPEGFDPAATRARMGTDPTHTAFVFVALGHFERKGLPLLLEALANDNSQLTHARLWVIGGARGLVASYRASAERMGIGDRVVFAGRTDDVRPFLWSADAFVAPSHYEAFSLGLLEAAAAGLPLIATRISGSEELLEDGVNGLEVQPTPASVSAALRRFAEIDPAGRNALRDAARQRVEPLRPERFAAAWRELYASLDH
jgi:glycosyltransferase involved in cell wall biosynthesis